MFVSHPLLSWVCFSTTSQYWHFNLCLLGWSPSLSLTNDTQTHGWVSCYFPDHLGSIRGAFAVIDTADILKMVHWNPSLKGLWPPLPGIPLLSWPVPAILLNAVSLPTHSSRALSEPLSLFSLMKRNFSSLYALPLGLHTEECLFTTKWPSRILLNQSPFSLEENHATLLRKQVWSQAVVVGVFSTTSLFPKGSKMGAWRHSQ